MIQLWISLLFFSNSHAFNKRFKFWKSEIWDNFPAVLKELLLVTECFVERSIAWRNFQHPILRSSVFCLWSSIFQTNRWEPTPTKALPKSNQVTVLGVEGMTSGFSSWGKLKKYQETYGYPTCRNNDCPFLRHFRGFHGMIPRSNSTTQHPNQHHIRRSHKAHKGCQHHHGIAWKNKGWTWHHPTSQR